MTPDRLLTKAVRACQSARVLLNAGDSDGACNRAYYAMFDAARGALVHVSSAQAVTGIRTHNGLIVAFSQVLVKTGRVDLDTGKALNRAYDLRQMADYTQSEISLADAEHMVVQAEAFVEAMTVLTHQPPSHM
jgi:uncharacterized protein (UPF0332 family)